MTVFGEKSEIYLKDKRAEQSKAKESSMLIENHNAESKSLNMEDL